MNYVVPALLSDPNVSPEFKHQVAAAFDTTSRRLSEALRTALAPAPCPIARVDLLKVGAWTMIRNRLQLYRPFAGALPARLDVAGMLAACDQRLEAERSQHHAGTLASSQRGCGHDGHTFGTQRDCHDGNTLNPTLRLKLDQARLALRWLRRFEPE